MMWKTVPNMVASVLKTGTQRRSVVTGLSTKVPKTATEQPVVDLNAKPFSDIPGPRGLPFLGTLLYFKTGGRSVEKFQDSLLERYHQYGNISKETIGTETVVHLFDPDYIQEMYQQEGKYPSIPPLIEASKNYREAKEMCPGLGNVNGSEWHRLRSAVQKKMLRPKEVIDYLPMMEGVADDFIDKLCRLRTSDGKIDGFFNEIAKWNLESSGMLCFETRIGGLDENTDSESQTLVDANNAIFKKGAELKFSAPWQQRGSTWEEHMEAEEVFFGTGQKYVDNTVKEIDKLVSSEDPNDDKYKLMTYLLSRKELSYKDISMITLSFFGDGLTSIVPSIVCNLYNLANNPDTQNRLMDEITAYVPKEGPISPNALQQLQYLRACIKETFRLFPIQVDIARLTTQDTVVGGYKIPTGVRVEFHNFVNLRNPEIFPEPDEFQPERWLKGGSAESVHPFIVLPFSHGPRMCIGRRFAEQDMQVVLVKLLQKFRVDWHNGQMGQIYRILMTLDCPADFMFTPRESLTNPNIQCESLTNINIQ